MVVRNSTAYPQTLQKKSPVARTVMATPVPEPPVKAQLQEGGQVPGSSYPQIDCHAKAWKAI